jgi:hypothetical protein
MKQIDEIRPSLLNDWRERSEERPPEGGTGGWKRYAAMLHDPTTTLLNEGPRPKMPARQISELRWKRSQTYDD